MRRLVGIIQSITPARLLTLAGVCFGFVLSRLLKRPILFSSPSFLTVEPVCGCNLQCPECPVGTNELVRPRGQISLETVDSIIEHLGTKAIWVNLYFQGEPLLHPNLPEIVAHFSKRKIFTSISTNGLLLTAEMVDGLLEAKLKEIIFSIDGASEEEYLAYRKGGSFSKVVGNIQMVAAKRKAMGLLFPRIVFQSLITSANEGNLKNIRRFAKSVGADAVELKTLNLSHAADSNNLLPSKSKFSRYSNLGKKQSRLSCFRLWSNTVIAWDGRMALCCMDKEVDAICGEVFSYPINSWNSVQLNGIRARLLTGVDIPRICSRCSLHTL
ncbi:radical SAM protein [Williamwhitmania taraxaci]|uniref:4Fe-4S single cluster domain-containing protein n=1 Tax=Williamwhitmania taraxaci TaxID=1640674 RepID=A0A1G6QH84_9BACT|nr:radical SAM protein [Williamwhitmania taraxaci]SDC91749.1 4Fe-4S single cluster domain-containing protein [Williamwhitmania taraxaci]